MKVSKCNIFIQNLSKLGTLNTQSSGLS